MGATATSYCSSSCAAPSSALCENSADCRGGTVCSLLPEGDLLLVPLGVEALAVCTSPEGGAASSSDGASDGGGFGGDASDAASSD